MTPRLFGKLPAHGDFVARGFAPREREVVDGWLSTSLERARGQFGASFEEAYDLAPAWRFSGPAGAGALAASMDAAGRRYPVWLLIDDAPPPAAGTCEDLLHAAIVQGWTADELVGAVEAAVVPAGPVAAIPTWWVVGAEQLAVAGERPATLVGAMLSAREQAA